MLARPDVSAKVSPEQQAPKRLTRGQRLQRKAVRLIAEIERQAAEIAELRSERDELAGLYQLACENLNLYRETKRR
jgi:hypothetical protein